MHEKQCWVEWRATRSLSHALADGLYSKPNKTKKCHPTTVKSKPTQFSFILISVRMPEKIKLLPYVINCRFGYLIQLIVHFRVDYRFGRWQLFLSDIIKHEKYKCIKKIKSSKVIESKRYSSKSLALSQTANCLAYRINYVSSHWLVQEHTELIIWVVSLTVMTMACGICSW